MKKLGPEGLYDQSIITLPLYLSLAALIIVAQQHVYFKMCYFIPYAQVQNNYIRNIIMPNALQ